MRISTRIEYDSIVAESRFMQFVDEFALNITLVIFELDCRKIFPECFKISFERFRSINRCLAFTEQVEIGAVEDKNFHVVKLLGNAASRPMEHGKKRKARIISD